MALCAPAWGFCIWSLCPSFCLKRNVALGVFPWQEVDQRLASCAPVGMVCRARARGGQGEGSRAVEIKHMSVCQAEGAG